MNMRVALFVDLLEKLSPSSIDVLIYPCPRETFKKYGHLESPVFREEVKKLGNKVMFPYLIDENTGEASTNQKTLWITFGIIMADRVPNLFFIGFPKGLSFLLGSLFHGLLRPLPYMGILRTPSKRPELSLELWGREHHVGTKELGRFYAPWRFLRFAPFR